MSLSTLQSRLQALVAAEPLLAGRPVLIEDKNNLVNQVETALQTQSLAVVIAPASGNANANQPKSTAYVDEVLEVVIHRGLLDADDVPSTVAIVDALIPRLHGQPILATAATAAASAFKFLRHDLRESGDGTYTRVIQFGAPNSW